MLVSNDDGIYAPGLRALVKALVDSDLCRVFVCAPDQERSGVAHCITTRETLEVGVVEIAGATAYETSGYPVDCVSLALSGQLFGGAKPDLVLSGINKGSNCGLHIIYSGTVAAAREAHMSGVPAIAFSLDWKPRVSSDDDFTAAAEACMPLVSAALRDIGAGAFPSGFFLNVDLPTHPQQAKGVRVSRQGSYRIVPRWVAASRRRTGAEMAAARSPGGAMGLPGMRGAGAMGGGPPNLGAQMAQLGLAASAAAARRSASKKEGQEKEEQPEAVSIGTARPGPPGGTAAGKQHFRAEVGEFDGDEADEGVDSVAVAQGWISVVPLALFTQAAPAELEGAQAWLAKAVGGASATAAL